MQITELMDDIAGQAAQLVDRLNPGHRMTDDQYAAVVARTGQAILTATLAHIAETDPAKADRIARGLHAAIQDEEAGAQ